MALNLESFFLGGKKLIKTILIILALLFVGMSVLFCYSACVISGRCSREEERRNDREKIR